MLSASSKSIPLVRSEDKERLTLQLLGAAGFVLLQVFGRFGQGVGGG